MKPIALDDVLRVKFLSQITFSPEGGSACFVVTEADRKKDGYRSCLYLRREGKVRKLTTFGKERSFQFLDEDTVLFAGNREEEAEAGPESRFYRISLSGGEAEIAYTFPIPVTKIMPLPGGDLVVVGRTMPGFEELYLGQPKEMARFRKYRKENADYEEIAQVPWWHNGGTFSKGSYPSLYYYEAKRRRLSRLTEAGEAVLDAEISPDGACVYYLSTPVRPLMSFVAGKSLKRLRLADRGVKVIAEDSETFVMRDMKPGKSFLLLIAADNHNGVNTDGDFFRVDYETEEVAFYAKHGFCVGSSVGTDVRYGGGASLRMDGDVCYFISTRFDGAYLFRLEDGVITQITDRPGSVDCFDVRGGKMLLVALYGQKAKEIYDEKGRQVTHLNDAVLRGRYVAVPEVCNVARDGYEVHGFVLKPMDYVPGRKYPVILDIHGGPKTVYGPVLSHEMQYWAGKGYFVIFCNPTGSDGRGDFMNILGKYGTVDYEDLMAFADEALKRYLDMDEGQFFETGGSYGGFMTNWIIGHTDRFRACASQRSIANWFSMYGVSDIGVGFTEDQNAADIWGNPEKLWFHSPLKYADRVKTPTLFIHSMEDYRCPIDQGYQMFTALVAHGVETKMVCFKGENHELSRSGRPSHRLKRLSEITEWFEKHRTDRG